jgi:hypothetical protein
MYAFNETDKFWGEFVLSDTVEFIKNKKTAADFEMLVAQRGQLSVLACKVQSETGNLKSMHKART